MNEGWFFVFSLDFGIPVSGIVFFSLSSCCDQVSIKVKGCSSSQGRCFGAFPLMVLGYLHGSIQGNPHMLSNKKQDKTLNVLEIWQCSNERLEIRKFISVLQSSSHNLRITKVAINDEPPWLVAYS
jgi:hypothetical protein